MGDAIPPDGYKLLRGTAVENIPERPPLSCIAPAAYVPFPDSVRDAVMPRPRVMSERRLARHQFLVEQTAAKRRENERLLGKTFSEEQNARRQLSQLRKDAKSAMAVRRPIDPNSVAALETCRFRNITIKECLTQVCVDQKEYIPVWGNWNASVAEPLTVNPGEQPAFTITDCVTEGNGYTESDGWISVSGTIRMTQAVYVNELGVNFTGIASYDTDGEDHTFWANEWGAISIGSSLEVRSSPAGGGFTNLVGPESWRFEVIESNDEGPVAPMPFMPANRSVAVNRNVDVGHTFILDYVLKWDVTRSDDYNASSCFALANFVIKPYIIYQSCHSEYRRVLELIQQELAARERQP